jgi:PAS domain S-box-containing protein
MPEDVMRRLEQLSEPGAILDPDITALVLDFLPDAVIVTDDKGVMRLVNRAAELLFGYTRQNMVGELLEMLLPDRLRERHTAHRRQFFDNPHSRPMGIGIGPLMGLRSNGTEVELSITIGPLVTGRGVYGVAVVRRRDAHAAES